MAGSDAENLQLPPFVQQAGAKSDERSILVVDSHDTEPFSGLAGGWDFGQSGVNLLSDRQLVSETGLPHEPVLHEDESTAKRSYWSLVGSMTSYGMDPCAQWDGATGKVMAHKAFPAI